ncbi:hypothetical protein GCM10023187_22040 [Nibrella viscosa]|uniref:LTXXQ motif family protein n=1 Tax=Nibrella viscosa TaxID=1084524 RepID=A0ABP8KER7_9BACT
MKHVLSWLMISLTLVAGTAAAQNDQGRQKIETAKIGLITNRLNLTTEQAPQFWAVYNEYNTRKQDMYRRLRQLNQQTPRQNSGDATVIANLREMNTIKQQIADLDGEYMNKFLKVISPKQLAELYEAERMFNKMLIDKLNNPND